MVGIPRDRATNQSDAASVSCTLLTPSVAFTSCMMANTSASCAGEMWMRPTTESSINSANYLWSTSFAEICQVA